MRLESLSDPSDITRPTSRQDVRAAARPATGDSSLCPVPLREHGVVSPESGRRAGNHGLGPENTMHPLVAQQQQQRLLWIMIEDGVTEGSHRSSWIRVRRLEFADLF